MHLRVVVVAALLLGLASCGTTRPDAGYTPPWLLGQAGPPFPYNSPYCP